MKCKHPILFQTLSADHRNTEKRQKGQLIKCETTLFAKTEQRGKPDVMGKLKQQLPCDNSSEEQPLPAPWLISMMVQFHVLYMEVCPVLGNCD
jgi:hypothetical protein